MNRIPVIGINKYSEIGNESAVKMESRVHAVKCKYKSDPRILLKAMNR